MKLVKLQFEAADVMLTADVITVRNQSFINFIKCFW